MDRKVQKIDNKLPAHPKLKNVAAYCRVSSGKDAMLHSLSAQVSYYSNKIQSYPGWRYCGVYADEAMTGTKDSRDAFQRMLSDCRTGKIDMIITKSISRFARNTVTLLSVARELKGLGIDIYFEEQNIHTISGDGELMLTMLASCAQEESRSASENQKWRIRKSYEQGEVQQWRRLYGYNISKDKIEIIGAFMFELFDTDNPIMEFDNKLWLSVIDNVLVKRDGTFLYHFKNGTQVEV